MDDEESRRLDRLDYSTDSAERPYEAPDHDERSPVEQDGRSDHRTRFDPSEAPDETVERDGKVYQKWEWLAQLNENARLDERRSEKRQAERRRDVRVLVQSTNEFANQNDEPYELDERRVHQLLDVLVDAEDDLLFGSVPVEVPILAAISLAANEQQWPIRRTDLFEQFVESYIPEDNDADRGGIMRMRQRIRDAMAED